MDILTGGGGGPGIAGWLPFHSKHELGCTSINHSVPLHPPHRNAGESSDHNGFAA